MLTSTPAVHAVPKPKGLSRARRNLRWLEMREKLGCTHLEIAALTGFSLRAVKDGVREARESTPVAALFTDDEVAEFSATPEGREFLARNTARR